jgi:carboxyl-terminal processing protease
MTADERKLNVDSFELVWRTVRDKHFDPKLNGLDWKAIHDELRPRIDKATSSDECRKIGSEMLGRLGQSHFAIIPAAAYREINKDSSASEKGGDSGRFDRGTPGFAVRIVDGVVLIVKVDDGLEAAKMGVKTGWRVVKIDNQSIAATLTKVRESNKEPRFLDYLLNAAVAERLRGKVGDKKAIVFETGDGTETSLTIPLSQPPGIAARLGNLPVYYVSIQNRTLDGNIGYFSLSAFFEPTYVMKELGDAVKANLKANGFILDLRGNPGGIGGMAMGVGGWFVNKKDQKLGTLFARTGSLNFTINPRAETYDGPLAILVDGESASTTEVFTGGLQDLGRAKVFGSRSAGVALPAQIMRLPNGDGFLYAIANYISAGGKALEGKGVVPDFEVPLRRSALLKGQDAVLDAAVEWIRSQKK